MVDIVLECTNDACQLTTAKPPAPEMVPVYEIDQSLKGHRTGKGTDYLEVWECPNCHRDVILRIKRGEPASAKPGSTR